jgi:hypothetical protein
MFNNINLKISEKFEDVKSLEEKINNLNNQITSLKNDIMHQQVILQNAKKTYLASKTKENSDEYQFQEYVDKQNQQMLSDMEKQRSKLVDELYQEKIKEYQHSLDVVSKSQSSGESQSSSGSQSYNSSKSSSDSQSLNSSKSSSDSQSSNSSKSSNSSNSSSDTESSDKKTDKSNDIMTMNDIKYGSTIKTLMFAMVLMLVILIILTILLPQITKNKMISSILISLINFAILIVSLIIFYMSIYNFTTSYSDTNISHTKINVILLFTFLTSLLGFITFSMCGIPNIKTLFKDRKSVV